VFLYSCGSDVIIESKNYRYNKTFSGGHKVEFDIYLENVGYSKKVSRLVKKLVYQNMSFDKFAVYLENDFIERFSGDDGVYTHNSHLSEDYNIVYHDAYNVIIQNNYYYIYRDMAHGYYAVNFYIIDIKEERILNIEDILNPIPDDILKELIEKDYEMEEYWRDNIWPPDTINIDRDGVEIVWGVYELAPYYIGWIWVDLPEEISKQYLTDRGRLIKSRIFE